MLTDGFSIKPLKVSHFQQGPEFQAVQGTLKRAIQELTTQGGRRTDLTHGRAEGVDMSAAGDSDARQNEDEYRRCIGTAT